MMNYNRQNGIVDSHSTTKQHDKSFLIQQQKKLTVQGFFLAIQVISEHTENQFRDI